MFEIRTRGFTQSFGNTANPAHCFPTTGLQMEIRTGVGLEAWAGFVLALVAYVALLWVWLDVTGRSIFDPTFLGSFALAVIGASVFVTSRIIASSKIYFIPIGAAFPIVNEYSVDAPMNWFAYYRKRFGKGIRSRHGLNFDFVVRGTEPNVSNRLERYSADERTWVQITFDALERAKDRFMHAQLPSPRVVRQFGRIQAEAADRIRDLWPVARLIISRVLYQRPKQVTYQRKRGEEAVKPEMKGSHHYFTFKLLVIPVAYWFLIIATSLLAPSLSSFQIASKDAAAGLAVIIVIWAICTVLYTRRVIKRWKKWLAESSSRPLGTLPLFLHVPWNDRHSRWEELDEFDFQDYLDEFVLDTGAAFQIIVGIFAGTALTISRLLV